MVATVTDTAGAAAALARTDLLTGLSPEVLSRLAASAVRRAYARGQMVCVEGEPGTTLYVLTSGSVAVLREAASGERLTLRVQRPPEVFGELALLDDAPRSATVEALEPTTVLTLARPAFLDVVHREPAAIDALLRGLGATVRRLTDQATDHVFLDLGGRVAKVLLQLAEGLPPSGPRDLVPVTQGRLAEMTGGTRQSVNQVLAGFAQRGLVRVEGRSVRLLAVPALRRRAELPPEAPDRV